MPYCHFCEETVESIDYTAECSEYPYRNWTEKCCYNCSDEGNALFWIKKRFAFKKTGRSGKEVIESNCPKGSVVVWNRWDYGFKYRKLDKDGYII